MLTLILGAKEYSAILFRQCCLLPQLRYVRVLKFEAPRSYRVDPLQNAGMIFNDWRLQMWRFPSMPCQYLVLAAPRLSVARGQYGGYSWKLVVDSIAKNNEVLLLIRLAYADR